VYGVIAEIERFTIHRSAFRGRYYLDVEIDGDRYGHPRDGGALVLCGSLADASNLLTGTTLTSEDGIFAPNANGGRTRTAGGSCRRVMVAYGDAATEFEFDPFAITDPLEQIRDQLAERFLTVTAWVESVYLPEDVEESIEVVVTKEDP
jgi:hypothetical protein